MGYLLHGRGDTTHLNKAHQAFGLKPVAPAAKEFALWPENMPALQVFLRLRTQWVVGLSGATGLNHAAAPLALRLAEIPRAQWGAVMADVQVIELEMLRIWREKK
ncbi:hypothetical protein GN316_15335 [Xylophilus sp. Kf1]|nr:hypothetical protein [Xylophilus sp. Kf1]